MGRDNSFQSSGKPLLNGFSVPGISLHANEIGTALQCGREHRHQQVIKSVLTQQTTNRGELPQSD